MTRIRIECRQHPGHVGRSPMPTTLNRSGKKREPDKRYTECGDCRRWFLPTEITLNGGKTK